MKIAPLAAACAALLTSTSAFATSDPAADTAAVDAVEPQLIAWRRDLHAHPELANREVRTAQRVAAALRDMNIAVREGVAVTGVVGTLRGALPGPTIALRADMDALPVSEPPGLPFASTATTTYRGQTTGVMHACGHDAHVAILLATARVLADRRDRLRGTILFVFQPAEEGAPDGETGGAARMLQEDVFGATKPEAIFGLHVASNLHVGEIGVRSGPMMAASDRFRIVVKGRQTHGGRPWLGVDPINVASQIVLAANTIIARQVDLTEAPAVLTFGAIQGGIRENIVPDDVTLIGTIRTFTDAHRKQVADRLTRTATRIAEASDAAATVTIERGVPVLVNDADLSRRSIDALQARFGASVRTLSYVTSSEDFAEFAQVIPAFFFRLGVTAANADAERAPTNHSPQFMIDERGLRFGVEAMLALVERATEPR